MLPGCFQIQSEGFSPQKCLLRRNTNNLHAKLKIQPHQHPAVSLTRRIITVAASKVAKCQPVWSDLLLTALQSSGISGRRYDTMLPPYPCSCPDTKAAERFPLLWVYILYSDVCQEPNVVKPHWDALGDRLIKTQSQNLHSCPGGFIFHIFRSGITLSTGLWVYC